MNHLPTTWPWPAEAGAPQVDEVWIGPAALRGLVGLLLAFRPTELGGALSLLVMNLGGYFGFCRFQEGVGLVS